MKIDLYIPDDLRQLAEKHFVLLQRPNPARKHDTISLRLSGYGDAIYLMADLVKVCLLALENTEGHPSAHIPKPETNISGVLAVVLDLIPYEEADLLDTLREATLNPVPPEEEDWDFIYTTITFSPPLK